MAAVNVEEICPSQHKAVDLNVNPDFEQVTRVTALQTPSRPVTRLPGRVWGWGGDGDEGSVKKLRSESILEP